MTANKLEWKARELLAEEYEREGMAPCAAYLREPSNELLLTDQPAIRAIRRALDTARQSEGMVLVPREPTEAMLDAGLRAEAFKRDEIHAYDDPAAVYRAMLAAAPADAGEG